MGKGVSKPACGVSPDEGETVVSGGVVVGAGSRGSPADSDSMKR